MTNEQGGPCEMHWAKWNAISSFRVGGSLLAMCRPSCQFSPKGVFLSSSSPSLLLLLPPPSIRRHPRSTEARVVEPASPPDCSIDRDCWREGKDGEVEKMFR